MLSETISWTSLQILLCMQIIPEANCVSTNNPESTCWLLFLKSRIPDEGLHFIIILNCSNVKLSWLGTVCFWLVSYVPDCSWFNFASGVIKWLLWHLDLTHKKITIRWYLTLFWWEWYSISTFVIYFLGVLQIWKPPSSWGLNTLACFLGPPQCRSWILYRCGISEFSFLWVLR